MDYGNRPIFEEKICRRVGRACFANTPPTLIPFSLDKDNKLIHNQDFDDWYSNAPEGGIALAVCTAGGSTFQVQKMFYCILQKGTSPYLYGLGSVLNDEGNGISIVRFRINTVTGDIMR